MKINIFQALTRKPLQYGLRIVVPIAALVLLSGLYIRYQPRLVYIVEDQFIEAWEQALPSSPVQKAKLVPLSIAESDLPRQWYGYRIGSHQSPGALNGEGEENPIRVYRGLAGQGRYGEALPLAADPWLLFRRSATPPLNREMAERGTAGRGQIFMAGSEQTAIWAWTAQLLQEAPGVFSGDEERWNRIGERLFIGRNFQAGAKTYHWEMIWPHLLAEDESAWVYSPLSLIQALPAHDTGSLKADAFPARPGWSELGLQAEILWAIPYGSEKNQKKLASAETWLQSAHLQAQIANALGWLAAHRSSPPPGSIAESAQAAWLAASYVWEAPVR